MASGRVPKTSSIFFIYGCYVITFVVLLLIVTAQDANLLNITVQEAPENGVSETTGSAGDQEDFVFENGHNIWLLFDYCFRLVIILYYVCFVSGRLCGYVEKLQSLLFS